jgi:predicted SnoaL-like aldol condensation-catalyzing enzyme
MKAIISIVALGILSAPVHAQLPVTTNTNQQALLKSDNRKLAANKKLVFDFWREVFQTHDMSKAAHYMAEDYMQHNPNVPTGRQPFMDFFGKLPRQPVKPEIDNLVTLLAEGDMVVLAFRREMPDPQNAGKTYTTTWFDMFRIKDGKLAEHWDFGTKAPRP